MKVYNIRLQKQLLTQLETTKITKFLVTLSQTKSSPYPKDTYSYEVESFTICNISNNDATTVFFNGLKKSHDHMPSGQENMINFHTPSEMVTVNSQGNVSIKC